jgi:hypothetical protein
MDSPLWRRYDKEVEMYHFYIDMAVKISLFSFSITGALAAYYFTNPTHKLVVQALVVPIVLNAGLAVLLGFSAKESAKMAAEHRSTCEELKIVPFNMNPLPSLCIILMVMYVTVFGALGFIYCATEFGAGAYVPKAVSTPSPPGPR